MPLPPGLLLELALHVLGAARDRLAVRHLRRLQLDVHLVEAAQALRRRCGCGARPCRSAGTRRCSGRARRGASGPRATRRPSAVKSLSSSLFDFAEIAYERTPLGIGIAGRRDAVLLRGERVAGVARPSASRAAITSPGPASATSTCSAPRMQQQLAEALLRAARRVHDGRRRGAACRTRRAAARACPRSGRSRS